jgi:ABC-2 type transport system ATP-binding protein
MLTLLKSLAQRQGKSLLFSTHLLGDIEHVCKHAIIMEKGKVAASGALDLMLESQANAFLIRWKHKSGSKDDVYLAALEQSGAEVSPSEKFGQARVVVTDAWSKKQFFQLAKEAQVTLIGLEPEEIDLRTVYQRVLGNKLPPVIDLNKPDGSEVDS